MTFSFGLLRAIPKFIGHILNLRPGNVPEEPKLYHCTCLRIYETPAGVETCDHPMHKETKMKVKQTWEINKKDARFRGLDDEAILDLIANSSSMSLGMVYIYDEESSETMLKGPMCCLVTTKIEIEK